MTNYTNAADKDGDAGAADSGWNPDPVALRDGEQTDERAHAARTAAQVRIAEREGVLDGESA